MRARNQPAFHGLCVGTAAAGTCTLDEPEGNNPATNGSVTYARTGDLLSFTISPDHAIQEVQICMQTTGAFAVGANVCAGSHGHHVASTHTGNVYVVNLATEGFALSNPLYWTLHVVSNGSTLQVLSPVPGSPPSTTTTTSPATTSTTHKSSTTTTTTHASTTTTDPSTTTTTTTAPSTTTTDPSTTTTTSGLVTTTTAPSQILGVTTSQPTKVLGETLSRTGGVQWWVLVGGAVLLLVGACLLVSTRRVQGATPGS